jgi:hypothetical protein
MSDTPRTDVAEHNMGSVVEPHYVVDVDCSRQLERELAEAQAKISTMRRWVNNNMTFYDVEPNEPHGPNTPTLAGVSKRIWYHATDNQTVSLFSEVIDLRQWEGK